MNTTTLAPERKCAICSTILSKGGHEGEEQFKRRLFCSKACYLIHHAGKRHDRICGHCGTAFTVYGQAKRNKQFCSLKCRYAAAKVEHHRFIDNLGYARVKDWNYPEHDARGYSLEHRIVASKMIGRILAQAECVHHKNGIRSDNRPENLHIFASAAEHMKHHDDEWKRIHGVSPRNTPSAVKKRWNTRRLYASTT